MTAVDDDDDDDRLVICMSCLTIISNDYCCELQL